MSDKIPIQVRVDVQGIEADLHHALMSHADEWSAMVSAAVSKALAQENLQSIIDAKAQRYLDSALDSAIRWWFTHDGSEIIVKHVQQKLDSLKETL